MKAFVRQIVTGVTRIFGTFVATLREIFDEAAYARFLNRAGMKASSEAYAAFREEFEEYKVRRTNCC